MELTNGSEEIKARRIEWHVSTHGSDSKGIVEHCTTEEELEEYEDYEDGMMKDDDTLSEELTAGSGALPKIRTHTKHFTNYSAYCSVLYSHSSFTLFSFQTLSLFALHLSPDTD